MTTDELTAERKKNWGFGDEFCPGRPRELLPVGSGRARFR